MLDTYEPLPIQTALPSHLRGAVDPFRKESRPVVSLPVIQHNHVTHKDDRFQCASYGMKLSAEMCMKRQDEANKVLRTKDKWMSGRGNLDTKRCRDCSTGKRTADFVRRGARRAPAAERKGSVVLPERTRLLLTLMFAEEGVAAVARKTKLSRGTITRAATIGTIRRESFEILRELFPAPEEKARSAAA